MSNPKSSSEGPHCGGMFRTELSSVLSLPFGVPGLRETGSLNEALEKLAERADVLLGLLDLEMTQAQSSLNVRVARDLARALGLILKETVCVPSLADLVPSSEVRMEKSHAPADKKALGFTPRQRQVLELLLEGKSNKEIAQSLKLGEGTVKIHMAALFRVLGVVNRAGAAVVGTRLLDHSASIGISSVAPTVAAAS